VIGLPNKWAVASLKQLTTKVGSGATPRGGGESYKPKGTPLIRSMNVIMFGFKREGLAFIDQNQSRALQNVEVHAGDVLLNITGASIGRVTLAPTDFQGARVNQHVCIIRPTDALDARYLAAYLSSPSMQAEIGAEHYGMTRQALTKQQILDFEIPIAPHAEQMRIADKIDTLVERIKDARERVDRILPLLKRFREAVLEAAVSGKLTEDWRGDTTGAYQSVAVAEPYHHVVRGPSSWVSTNLRGMCEFVGGSQPAKSTFQYVDGPDLVRLVQIRDYKSDKHRTFIPRALARRFCNSQDVMIGRYGPPIFQILRGLEGAYNVALMKAVPEEGLVSREYLYYLLKGANLLRFVVAGSDRTAGQDGVRKEQLESYPAFRPPLSEQEEIVRRLDQMLTFADGLQRRYENAVSQVEKVTPSVLAKAFRGELVPQDPNDEPAGEMLERIKGERNANVAPRPKNVTIAPGTGGARLVGGSPRIDRLTDV
jgi:type I restriction enzyme, S subunit